VITLNDPLVEIRVAIKDSLNTRSAPCDLPPEEFRAIGHSLVDSIADFLHELPAAPTATSLLPDSLRSALGQRAMPERGRDIAPVITEFSEKFFKYSTHNGSPRFFGYVIIRRAHRGFGRYARRGGKSKLRCVGAVADRD